MAFLMGIDLGTSSVRAMIIREDGARLALESERYDIAIPGPGRAEQSPEMWYEKTAACIKRAVAAAKISPAEIRALSFSGQMHGLVCLDSAGRPVRPAIIWPDQRSADAIRDIYARVGKETVARNTQNAVATGFLIASLYWLAANEPHAYKKTASVMLPKDYIKFRLCGSRSTDYSDAAGSLAFDNASLVWASELLNALALDTGKFPECLPSTAEVARVSRIAAGETGLAPGTRVINGGADQPMQAIGNGIVKDGVFAINIGTGGQVSVSMGSPVFDPELRTATFAHVVPNRWYIMGAALSSGASLKWLAKNVLENDDFAALDAAASKTPPMGGGLFFLPYLTGERTPHLDPDARGVFWGLTPEHTRAHLVRAVMEGVLFSLRECLEIITGLGLPCERIIASGGGSNSPFWLQMQADMLNRPVMRSAMNEQACFGAAITAGVGSGIYTDFIQATDLLVRMSGETFSPVAATASQYEKGFSLYKKLYSANKALFKEAAKTI